MSRGWVNEVPVMENVWIPVRAGRLAHVVSARQYLACAELDEHGGARLACTTACRKCFTSAHTLVQMEMTTWRHLVDRSLASGTGMAS